MSKPKYIETPERMWELFVDYVNETKNNPRKRPVFGGRDFSKSYEELERPLTLEGFYNYCAKNVGCAKQYFFNQDNLYTDYITICSRIKDEIRQDQIEGGMVGQYNPSITQRLNGLTEKQEIDHKGDGITKIIFKDPE